jgi:actin
VVIDVGGYSLKAGFSGEDKPRLIIPSVVAYPIYPCLMPDLKHPSVYIGEDYEAKRAVLSPKYPFSPEELNYDEIQQLLGHVFSRLNVDTSHNCVCLTTRFDRSKLYDERMCTMMFEDFNTPGYVTRKGAVLTLYGYGRHIGTVVEIGDSTATVMPIFEGYAINHAISCMHIGGSQITKQLGKSLTERGYQFNYKTDKSLLNEIKKEVCYIANDYEAELEKPLKETYYTLPDGHTITIGNESFRCPEVLFQPIDIEDEMGIAQRVYNSIMKSEIDLRKELFSSIVLSGGSTLIRGFSERLEKELTALSPSPVKIFSQEPELISWYGASSFSSILTFKQTWISKEEYDERGPSIIHIKCY